jgi:hypothetical protein
VLAPVTRTSTVLWPVACLVYVNVVTVGKALRAAHTVLGNSLYSRTDSPRSSSSTCSLLYCITCRTSAAVITLVLAVPLRLLYHAALDYISVHTHTQAYHNWVMKDLSLSESSYPMNLAETASIFFEVHTYTHTLLQQSLLYLSSIVSCLCSANIGTLPAPKLLTRDYRIAAL